MYGLVFRNRPMVGLHRRNLEISIVSVLDCLERKFNGWHCEQLLKSSRAPHKQLAPPASVRRVLGGGR